MHKHVSLTIKAVEKEESAFNDITFYIILAGGLLKTKF